MIVNVSGESRQTVRCAWCGWEGKSPIKKKLVTAGLDYPLECHECGAIGLQPSELLKNHAHD